MDAKTTQTTVRFRCACGRSVSTPKGSDADRARRCLRCRRRTLRLGHPET